MANPQDYRKAFDPIPFRVKSNEEAQEFDVRAAEEFFAWFVELEICESPPQLDETSLQNLLKDGKILCKLALKLVPGSIAKINEGPGMYKEMENIGQFITWAGNYGLPNFKILKTNDLLESPINHVSILDCFRAVHRNASLRHFSPLVRPRSSVAEAQSSQEPEAMIAELAD